MYVSVYVYVYVYVYVHEYRLADPIQVSASSLWQLATRSAKGPYHQTYPTLGMGQ